MVFEEGQTNLESNTMIQGVNGQSVLFDILQTKLSENVHPKTSQHLAVGQHCIDMLLRKDQFREGQTGATAGKGPVRKPTKGKGKGSGQKGGTSDQKSHLSIDNALHHVCKLKYPSLGGNS